MSFTIKKRKFRWLLALALMYLFVFQPPIVPKIYYPITEAIVFLGFLFLNPWAIRIFRKFQVEILLGILILLFSLVRDFASAEIVYADRFAVWFFQSLILGIPVAVLLLAYDDSLRDSLPTPLTAAVVLAAVLTLALYYWPAFDLAYRAYQIDTIYDVYDGFDVRYRAYGVSENLTFTYGYLLGSFAGYFFLRAEKNFGFMVLALICLVGVGLNARVGFLAFAIFVIYGVVLEQKWKSLVLLLSGVSVAWIFILPHVSESISVQWSQEFFREMGALIFGGDYGASGSTAATLFGDFIVWPETTVHWMFGNGESLFGAYGRSSDVGYILQLNYAGIFFLALVLIFQGFTSWRVIKCLGMRHWFTYYFVSSLIILNTKGFLFAATPGGRLVFFLYIFFLLRFYFGAASGSSGVIASYREVLQRNAYRGRRG